jgi:polysaccharide export outer membrane protein
MNRTGLNFLRSSRRGHLLALAFAVSLAACGGSVAQSRAAVPSPPLDPTSTPLTPGDALRLRFWLEPALSGEYAIDESGVVVLPLLGSRSGTVVPAVELKRQLQVEYAKEIQNQEVAIVVLRRVRVLGAVQRPGLYYMDPTMTLGDVVALAGGVTANGKQDEITLFHAGHEIGADLPLNELAMRYLTSGDQIVVPERTWFSRNGAVIIGAVITATGFILAAAAFQ